MCSTAARSSASLALATAPRGGIAPLPLMTDAVSASSPARAVVPRLPCHRTSVRRQRRRHDTRCSPTHTLLHHQAFALTAAPFALATGPGDVAGAVTAAMLAAGVAESLRLAPHFPPVPQAP